MRCSWLSQPGRAPKTVENFVTLAKKEFYICFQPASFLDGKYTVFGKVVSGMEVVDGIKVGDKMKSVKITEE